MDERPTLGWSEVAVDVNQEPGSFAVVVVSDKPTLNLSEVVITTVEEILW